MVKMPKLDNEILINLSNRISEWFGVKTWIFVCMTKKGPETFVRGRKKDIRTLLQAGEDSMLVPFEFPSEGEEYGEDEGEDGKD